MRALKLQVLLVYKVAVYRYLISTVTYFKELCVVEKEVFLNWPEYSIMVRNASSVEQISIDWR